MACADCWCYVCEQPVASCTDWGAHAMATDKGPKASFWRRERKRRRRPVAAEEAKRKQEAAAAAAAVAAAAAAAGGKWGREEAGKEEEAEDEDEGPKRRWRVEAGYVRLVVVVMGLCVYTFVCVWTLTSHPTADPDRSNEGATTTTAATNSTTADRTIAAVPTVIPPRLSRIVRRGPTTSTTTTTTTITTAAARSAAEQQRPVGQRAPRHHTATSLADRRVAVAVGSACLAVALGPVQRRGSERRWW